MRGFQNGLIYLSSITSFQDMRTRVCAFKVKKIGSFFLAKIPLDEISKSGDKIFDLLVFRIGF